MSTLLRKASLWNLVDNSPSAVRERTLRVKHWQDGSMALR
jgi:hypothetical protein